MPATNSTRRYAMKWLKSVWLDADALNQTEWPGVWRNVVNLYVYWLWDTGTTVAGYGHATSTTVTTDAQANEAVLKWSAQWKQRRLELPRNFDFFNWLITVAKPIDDQVLPWFPAVLPEYEGHYWRRSFANPRHLPSNSMWLVNAARMFSNQRSYDGPFIMALYKRGWKNANQQFISPKTRDKVVTEYAKYKYPPLSWIDTLPYNSKTITDQWGRQKESPSGKRMSMRQWRNKLTTMATQGQPQGWSWNKLGVLGVPMYYSIEPDDLHQKGGYMGRQPFALNFISLPDFME